MSLEKLNRLFRSFFTTYLSKLKETSCQIYITVLLFSTIGKSESIWKNRQRQTLEYFRKEVSQISQVLSLFFNKVAGLADCFWIDLIVSYISLTLLRCLKLWEEIGVWNPIISCVACYKLNLLEEALGWVGVSRLYHCTNQSFFRISFICSKFFSHSTLMELCQNLIYHLANHKVSLQIENLQKRWNKITKS